MPRYHINPETGNPGVCHAKVACPFGSMDDDHYDSKDEAREAFESGNNSFQETPSPLSMPKLVANDMEESSDMPKMEDYIFKKGKEELVALGIEEDDARELMEYGRARGLLLRQQREGKEDKVNILAHDFNILAKENIDMVATSFDELKPEGQETFKQRMIDALNTSELTPS
jgi:hypothetical protein